MYLFTKGLVASGETASARSAVLSVRATVFEFFSNGNVLCARSFQGFIKGVLRLLPGRLFRNGLWLDAHSLSLLTPAFWNLHKTSLVACKASSSLKEVRRGKRRLLHEQGCASSVSGHSLPREGSRDLAADSHLPSEKDFINVDKLFLLRVIQSWRRRRSQYSENI